MDLILKLASGVLKTLTIKHILIMRYENPIDVYHNNEGLREDDFKNQIKGL